MSSSMQLAKDCLEREGGGTQMEAMERFAQYIDNSKFDWSVSEPEQEIDNNQFPSFFFLHHSFK